MGAWRTFKLIHWSGLGGGTPTTTKLVEIENRNAFILINGWMPLKVLREFMCKTRGQFGHPFYAIVDKESNRELVHRRHDSKIHINLT